MLKLYKKTIIVATTLGVFFVIVSYFLPSVLSESTYSFLQNCLIGIACSLQYINEHRKVFYEYKRNLRKLYINICTLKTIDIDSAPMLGLNTYIDIIDQCFENLKKCAMDLCWFHPKYKRKYNIYFSEIIKLMMNFIRDQYDKPRKALIEISAYSAVEIKENTTETKALLNVKEVCTYLGIGQTKARELLSDPANGFTVRIDEKVIANYVKNQGDEYNKMYRTDYIEGQTSLSGLQ